MLYVVGHRIKLWILAAVVRQDHRPIQARKTNEKDYYMARSWNRFSY